jgi:hypothetical protein
MLYFRKQFETKHFDDLRGEQNMNERTDEPIELTPYTYADEYLLEGDLVDLKNDDGEDEENYTTLAYMNMRFYRTFA